MDIEMRRSICYGFANVLLVNNGACLGGLDAHKSDHYWYLTRLIVKPMARGNGYGKKMIEWLQSQEQVKEILVHPGGYDLELERIISFYEHMGFKEYQEGYIWRLTG